MECQELFLYCNDANEDKYVKATTCNGQGTANFDHQLAAFRSRTGECSLAVLLVSADWLGLLPMSPSCSLQGGTKPPSSRILSLTCFSV